MSAPVETKTTLTKENGVWVLRVERGDGKTQEYRCATEAQAQALVLVLTPKESK
jgi:hypothetical protein